MSQCFATTSLIYIETRRILRELKGSAPLYYHIAATRSGRLDVGMASSDRMLASITRGPAQRTGSRSLRLVKNSPGACGDRPSCITSKACISKCEDAGSVRLLRCAALRMTALSRVHARCPCASLRSASVCCNTPSCKDSCIASGRRVRLFKNVCRFVFL
ncbi:hypothetical protein AcW1_002284 [Taiwanofungus camphoratus]|nr:hypothetical protein AcV5_010287 [Antrodia cinnamomea]KAI0944615.1 hypothetical protein AcW1_002284 [Antrodia cinnamomea]